MSGLSELKGYAIACVVLFSVLAAAISGMHQYTARDGKGIPTPTLLEVVHGFVELRAPIVVGNKSVRFTEAIGVTARRVLLGTAVAVAVGLLFGVAFGRARPSWLAMQPTVDFFRSIPVTFFLPATATIWGIMDGNLPWLLATVPCSLIMLLQVRQGMARISGGRADIFALLCGRRVAWEMFVWFSLPQVVPDLVCGARLAASYCIVVVAVLEYMSVGNSTIGFGYFVAQTAFRADEQGMTYACIVVFGMAGYGVNLILELAERRAARWRADRESSAEVLG